MKRMWEAGGSAKNAAGVVWEISVAGSASIQPFELDYFTCRQKGKKQKIPAYLVPINVYSGSEVFFLPS